MKSDAGRKQTLLEWMARQQSSGVVLMSLFLMLHGLILMMNTSGEVGIGVDIHRKFYIYTRYKQLNWFGGGRSELYKKLKSLDLSKDNVSKQLQDDDYKDQLFWMQLMLGFLFMLSGLGLLVKKDTKCMLILAAVCVSINLFWFIGNPFLSRMDPNKENDIYLQDMLALKYFIILLTLPLLLLKGKIVDGHEIMTWTRAARANVNPEHLKLKDAVRGRTIRDL